MKKAVSTSSTSALVPYGSFEDFAADLRRVLADDYGHSISVTKSEEIAKKFDILLYPLL